MSVAYRNGEPVKIPINDEAPLAEPKYESHYPQELIEWSRNECERAIPKKGEEVGVLNPPSMTRFIVEVARPKWRVSSSCAHEWRGKYPEWNDAVKYCVEMYEIWLDRIASTGIGNAGWHVMAAKNRLKWSDRQDVTSAGQRLPAAQSVAIAGILDGGGTSQSLADALRRVGLMGAAITQPALPDPGGSDESAEKHGKTPPFCDTNGDFGEETGGLSENGAE